MKYFTRILFIAILICSLLPSCELTNLKTDIPSYVSIDSIQLSNVGAKGSASSKITDAWVNVDGNLLGIFELPNTFPILAKGSHKIMIRAGIKANGIAASRKWYQFYSPYIIDTFLNESTVLKLKPKVQYKPETILEFNENFESTGTHFDKYGTSDTTMIVVGRSTNNVFEDNYSGAILLPLNKSLFQAVSTTPMVLPKNQTPIFLEFNYKNNMEFKIGVYVNNRTESFIYESFYHVNVSANWNKIYYELTDIITNNINAVSFNIYIEAVKTNQNQVGEIYLDNIKIIHF